MSTGIDVLFSKFLTRRFTYKEKFRESKVTQVGSCPDLTVKKNNIICREKMRGAFLSVVKQFLYGGPGQDDQAEYGSVGGGQGDTSEQVQFF